jgi:hypothetical protein
VCIAWSGTSADGSFSRTAQIYGVAQGRASRRKPRSNTYERQHMKRRLITGALVLACMVGLSVPLIGADGVTTTNAAKTCKTIRHDETKLVWNATHTKQISEIVYKIVPEKATLDGYKPYVNVAVAVVVTQQVCSV